MKQQKPMFKLKYVTKTELKIDYLSNIFFGTPIVRPVITTEEFMFQILESISHNAPQGIVQNESVGGDGGITKNTGRKIETLKLTGLLTNKNTITFNRNGSTAITTRKYSDIRDDLLKIKENGYVVELVGHEHMKFLNRKWVITNVHTTLNSGRNYLTFTMDLSEYRQANEKTTNINLVNNRDLLNFNANYMDALKSNIKMSVFKR